MNFAMPLPIDAVLDELRNVLAAHTSAVLVAPPGAGKTTRVPLALMDESWLQGRKILVLEPRRIAARAAAERMAHSLSEPVGERIGLRARMVSKSGPKTRIEIVTEGVFTRMILDDPELSGIGAVLFDEFHERSLDADLGLALALDCQRGLRVDLRILPMSATLDGARVAELLGGAPIIASEGRAFPVATHYLGRDANARIEDQMTDAVMRALRAESGSILAFLPGQGEIRRVEERLKERISDLAIVLAPLYGAMDMKAQDLALAPAPKGVPKVVLATSIAETSITIEGVRVVIDSGLARVPRFEPDVGVTRLETVRVSRAGADQRRGRARRLLSPVGRAANAEPARLRRARDSLCRSCKLVARLRGMGHCRSPLAVLDRSAVGCRHRRRTRGVEGAGSARWGRPHYGHGQATAVAAIASPACPHGDFRSRSGPHPRGCRDRGRYGGARTWRQRRRSRTSAGGLPP
jgi:ATP-dependent helicase HrpB